MHKIMRQIHRYIRNRFRIDIN